MMSDKSNRCHCLEDQTYLKRVYWPTGLANGICKQSMPLTPRNHAHVIVSLRMLHRSINELVVVVVVVQRVGMMASVLGEKYGVVVERTR